MTGYVSAPVTSGRLTYSAKLFVVMNNDKLDTVAPIEQRIPNANLVIAAPDMHLYIICQQAYDETDGFYCDSVWYEKDAAKRKLNELRRAALAKANPTATGK